MGRELRRGTWGICGVEVPREIGVGGLQVSSELLHASDLLLPFTIGDFGVEVDVEDQEAADMPQRE